MATTTEIEALRRITAGAEGYTDQQLNEFFNAGMNETEIAYRVWNEIAASAAALVDTSESGSSRSLSQAHKNALTMAAQFAPQAQIDFEGAPIIKRTRRMVRG